MFQSTRNLERTIRAVERDQSDLRKRGDVKSAEAIGKDIARLQAELKRRRDAA